MKPHPPELRQRILDTYENEPMSQVKIARRFQVAQSVVTRLLKQYRQSGHLEPRPRPGRSKKLTAEQLQVVKEMVEKQPDITLGELCQAMHEQENVKVSEPTMSRMMKHLKLTRKKKRFVQPQKEVSESKGCDEITGTKSETSRPQT